MKPVIWTDKDGYKHRSLIRDNDPEEEAHRGIPHDPPDLTYLDWEGVKRDIHNRLVDSEIFTWADLQRKQQLRSIVLWAMKARIIALFREQEVRNE